MSADPYWNYVKLLCHFDGIDNSTRIFDERHHALTVVGDTTLKTLQKKFGSSSAYFDGISGYITSAQIADFALTTLDFTMEGWVYPRDTANSNPRVFGVGAWATYGLVLRADASTYPGKFSFWVWQHNQTTPLLVSTSDIVYEAWCHVAITRSGGTWMLFINGVLEATASTSSALAVTDSTKIFKISESATNESFYGYIDDVRLTVGVARYTATFTPPTAAFEQGPAVYDTYYGNVVLHCHFNGENNATTFVDQKGHTLAVQGTTPPKTITTNAKFGGSCAVGNQTGLGRISCGASSDYLLAADDFTIELNTYRFVGGNNQRIFSFTNSAGDETLSMWTDSSYFTTVKLGAVTALTPATATGNAWWHIALVRTGTALKIYLNGVLGGTYDIGTTSIDTSGVLYICGGPTTGLNEAIDEFRFTKGIARYTTNFTPPTEPFPDYAVQKLNGTVYDADSNPVAKTVRSYRSSDGLFVDSTVSNATTGAFELRATDTTEHFVVVHDATKNALVYDHIVPVI